MRVCVSTIFVLIISLLMLNACSKEASAKRKLKKLNIDFSTTSFLEQVGRGNAEAVDLFLRAGIDLAKDATGINALFLAVKGSHRNIIPMLLNKGVGIKAKDSEGWTPLMHAIETGNKEIVQLLIGAGADVNDGTATIKPLILAVRKGSTDIVQLLIDKGADVNIRSDKGETPLLAAVQLANISFISRLLEKGADINVRDSEGSSLIKKEAIRGNVAVLQALINNGANIHEKDNAGFSLSTIAAIYGNVDAVRILKKKGVTGPKEDTIFANLLGKKRSDPLVTRFIETLSQVKSIFDAGNLYSETSKIDGINMGFKQNRLKSIFLYSDAYNDNFYNYQIYKDIRKGDRYKPYAKAIPYDITFADSSEDVQKKIGHKPDLRDKFDIFHEISEGYFLNGYKLFVRYDAESKHILGVSITLR